MSRLKQFIQHFRLTAGPNSYAVPKSELSHDDQGRIARLVEERLSDDETLRGDLTDAGFGPILTFVTSRVPTATRQALSRSTMQQAEDDVSRSARALTRAIVAAAETGDLGTLSEQLGAPMFSDGETKRVIETLDNRFASLESPEARAERIVEILRSTVQEQNT